MLPEQHRIQWQCHISSLDTVPGLLMTLLVCFLFCIPANWQSSIYILVFARWGVWGISLCCPSSKRLRFALLAPFGVLVLSTASADTPCWLIWWKGRAGCGTQPAPSTPRCGCKPSAPCQSRGSKADSPASAHQLRPGLTFSPPAVLSKSEFLNLTVTQEEKDSSRAMAPN